MDHWGNILWVFCFAACFAQYKISNRRSIIAANIDVTDRVFTDHFAQPAGSIAGSVPGKKYDYLFCRRICCDAGHHVVQPP